MSALGELHAGDAIEPLIQLLENADEDERRAVAEALDAILTPSVEPVARRLWNGHDQKDKTDVNDTTTWNQGEERDGNC
jgi:HEAT repeat protein